MHVATRVLALSLHRRCCTFTFGMQTAMPQVGCKQLMWETEMLHFHIWHAKSHATSRLQAVNVEDRDVALSHLACKEPYHKQVASS